MISLRQTGPGGRGRLELELLWASTSGTQTKLASGTWSYAWVSCPHQDASGIPHIKKLIAEGRGPHFSIDDQGVVKFKNRLVVPSSDELRRKFLDEAHNSKLSIHLGSNKMYHDLRHLYWWPNMKHDITKYISEYDICGRVKADHMRTPRFL